MSNTFGVFYNNLSKSQRVGLWAVVQVFVLVVIVLLLQPLFRKEDHVEVVDEAGVLSWVPSESRENFKETLWQVVSNNVASVDRNVIDDVVVREDTYNEVEDGGTKSVNFIIDIDSLKQTYAVSIGWSKNPEIYGPNNVSIDCPPVEKMKYPETVCKGMYNDTYSVDLYLPHAAYPDGHNVNDEEPLAPNYIIHGDDYSKTIDVEVSICDAEKYKQEALNYLKNTPIQLAEYKINYRVNEVDVDCK